MNEISVPSVNELIEIGSRIIQKTKDFGLDELELYFSATDRFSLRIITNYVTTSTGLDQGVGIRAVIGKKVGFTSISSFDIEKIEEAVKIAAKIAKNRPEDPGFHHLPDPQRGLNQGGIYDEEIVSTSLSELVNISGKSVDNGFKTSENVEKIDFSLGRAVGAFAVVNSRGIDEGDRYTVIYSWSTAKTKKNDDVTTGSEFFVGRKMNRDEILEVPVEAVKNAEEMFNGKKLGEAVAGQIVLYNAVVQDFLWPLEFNVSARNVQDGRSRFVEKIGERVGSENFNIINDGTIPEGIRTSKVDGEGIPTRKLEILRNGILQSYIYDSYTAHKEGRTSTGNAARRNFETPPSPSFNNIYIASTFSGDVNDLIKEVDKGVFIKGFTMGSHLTDPLKGTFSITSLNAFYIESGEIKYPLKSVSASGNFFDLIRNVLKIANDHRLTFNGKIPSMLFDNVTFI